MVWLMFFFSSSFTEVELRLEGFFVFFFNLFLFLAVVVFVARAFL